MSYRSHLSQQQCRRGDLSLRCVASFVSVFYYCCYNAHKTNFWYLEGVLSKISNSSLVFFIWDYPRNYPHESDKVSVVVIIPLWDQSRLPQRSSKNPWKPGAIIRDAHLRSWLLVKTEKNWNEKTKGKFRQENEEWNQDFPGHITPWSLELNISLFLPSSVLKNPGTHH